MIDPFTYIGLPARVIFGPGKRRELPAEVERLGAERALVISTPEQRGDAEMAAGLLDGRAAGIHAGAIMHTPMETVHEARRVAANLNADCYVTVGGGTAIGLGKAIAIESDMPVLAVPTTYAGSEMSTIQGFTEDGVKTTRSDPRMLPKTVIYDPELTLSLPPSYSGPSGMNAIAHAVEALYAEHANPISSLIAEEGIRALGMGLPRVCAAPDDLEGRTYALYGSWLCGIALGAGGMALHHKLCHVVGGSFDLAHAQTHTIILPHAMAYNAPAAQAAMARVCRFPLLILVTMRGQWGEFNPWQVPMGQSCAAVLRLAGAVVYEADDADRLADSAEAAARSAFLGPGTAALLIGQQVVGAKTFGR